MIKFSINKPKYASLNPNNVKMVTREVQQMENVIKYNVNKVKNLTSRKNHAYQFAYKINFIIKPPLRVKKIQ